MHNAIKAERMIGSPTAMNQNSLVSPELICDAPSLVEPHTPANKLGSGVVPGTHELNPAVVQGSCGGDGLRVEASEGSHEICHALWTLKPSGKSCVSVRAWILEGDTVVAAAVVACTTMSLKHAVLAIPLIGEPLMDERLKPLVRA